jgi:AbrB family looped-hinge helix DNA binding protein
MTLTISNKGWVVIPAELRKKYHLHPGAEVVIVDYGGVLAIVPAMRDPIKQGRGILKGGTSLTKALVEERAADQKRDEAKNKRLRG